MPHRPLALPGCCAAVLLAAGGLSAAAPPHANAPSEKAPHEKAPHEKAPHPTESAPHPAASSARQQPIVIDAAYSYVDYRTNKVVFRNVAVSQGDTRLTADRAHANGVGFTNSEWTFDGHVLITLKPRGTLRAEQAVVQFRDQRITEATLTGKPAHFEQQRGDSRRPAQGHADRIVYTAKDDTVRLSGSAWLSDGRNLEISGPVLIYDIRNEQLQAASPSERRRVHITVAPQPAHRKGEAPAGEAPRRRPPP